MGPPAKTRASARPKRPSPPRSTLAPHHQAAPTSPRSHREVERIDRHKDGTVRAQGHLLDGLLHGYWEWFRKDGTRMRSGHFARGKQTGEWTTYDRAGQVVKVTQF